MLLVQGRAQWVGVSGLSHARLRWDNKFIRRYLASIPFIFLVNNFQTNVAASYNIPSRALFEVGVPYEV